MLTSIKGISAEEWDSVATTSSRAEQPLAGADSDGGDVGAAAVGAAGGDEGAFEVNPFTLHAFLSALEESGSAVPEAGWLPRHLVVRCG